MPVILIFGEACPVLYLHRLSHILHSLNYLFDQCLYRKQFLWIVYAEK